MPEKKWRTLSGEVQSKSETTASAGWAGFGVSMKNETSSFTNESKTTLGLSLFNYNIGYLLNIRTEIFIPIVTETYKSNKK